MIQLATEDYERLNSSLEELAQHETSLPLRCEKAVALIVKAIQSLKKRVTENGYPDETTEVTMNKEVIPLFFAQLIYYGSLYRIETMKPVVSEKARRKFYRNELYRLEDFFIQHREFIRYYRSGKTSRDKEYYTRRHGQSGLLPDISFPLWEESFCTACAYKIAMLLGMERLKEYLLNVMEQTKSSWTNQLQSRQRPALLWTASKTDMTEMIYALHASGVFNHGKATIKEITNYFEAVFGIRIGNATVTFQEILRRKEYTAFLDKLKNGLIDHADRIEEKHFRKNF